MKRREKDTPQKEDRQQIQLNYLQKKYRYQGVQECQPKGHQHHQKPENRHPHEDQESGEGAKESEFYC